VLTDLAALAILVTWFSIFFIAGRKLSSVQEKLEWRILVEEALDEAISFLRSRGLEADREEVISDLRVYLGYPILIEERTALALMSARGESGEDLVAAWVHEIIEMAHIKRLLGKMLPLVLIDRELWPLRKEAHLLAEKWEREYRLSKRRETGAFVV